jgi:allantoinase
MTAKVVHTFLRGRQILAYGQMVGEPTGQYLHRPTGTVHSG